MHRPLLVVFALLTVGCDGPSTLGPDAAEWVQADAGPPRDAGPPLDAGAPRDADPPRDVGPPRDAGPPRDVGPSAPVLGCAAPGTPNPASPLSGLPSAPGPHILALEALGDDEWLALSDPAPDPVFGVAPGRAWGGRAFVYVPSLRGAFFTGEGVHAFVKPDGYAMDDIWFYDVLQNRWVTIYPGMHIASFNECARSGGLAIDDHGQLTNGNGMPIPFHTLIHAWDFLTYDSTRNRFVWLAGDGMSRYYLPGLETIEHDGLASLQGQRDTVGVTAMSPWYYDIATHTFGRDPLTSNVESVSSHSAFTYLPEQDRYIDVGRSGVRYYDPDTHAWTRATDVGTRPTGYDHGVAYDRRRQRLYVGAGVGAAEAALFSYDLATDTWSRLSSEGGPEGSFGTNRASVMYDDAHDVITVLHYDERRFYAYEPDADRWSSRPMPDDVRVSYPSYHAFYEPDLNVYFVYAARDSGTNGKMWAYRYRR